MPVYEYSCSECGFEFEELHLSSRVATKYKDKFPCIECDEMAIRIPSVASFSFVETTPGNSGVHAHDYPDADRAVGSSAEKKWKRIYEEKDKKTAARKKHKTNALKKVGEEYLPLSKKEASIRTQALQSFKAAEKAGTVSRYEIPTSKK